MSNETMKTQANQLVDRGKEMVKAGQQRQVVFYNKNGNVIARTNLTILAVVAVVLFVTGMIPLAVIGMVVAMFMGIHAEFGNDA